jgi:hypothetical protein
MKMIYFCIIRIVSVSLTDTKNDFTIDTIKHFCSSDSELDEITPPLHMRFPLGTYAF